MICPPSAPGWSGGLRVAATVLCVWGAGSGAWAECRVALAMGLDVSASVDASEYALQVEGLVAALNAPTVADALFATPGGPVALAVYEWSGWDDRRLLLDWTMLTDPGVLADVSGTLLATSRVEMSDSTALGMALVEGGALLQRGPACWRRVLDISGDGKNNDGADPDMLDGEPLLTGVTVNALVIGADARAETGRRSVAIGELSSYFNAHVIRGPDAFVQVALGYADYERAMTRKLLRELAPTGMSAPEVPSGSGLDRRRAGIAERGIVLAGERP